MTLSGPFANTLGDDLETSLNLGSVNVVASEADGDSAIGQVNLSVIDDVPTMVVDGATSVVEGGSAVTGTWDNANYGADGAESVVVQITGQADTEVDLTSGAVTSIVLADGTGTLDVAADGTWSFTPANGLDQPVDVTFTVEVTDNDGDVASDDHTIAITDGTDPLDATPVTLTLDEDDLPDGSDTTPESLVTTQTLTFTAGSDGFTSIAFGPLATFADNLTADSDLTTAAGDITWDRVSDTQITGSVGGNVVVTLDLINIDTSAGTADVRMTLSGPFANTLGDDLETSLNLGSVNVVASEADGDSAIGQVNLSVIDDVPTMVVDGATSVVEGGAAVTGTWDNANYGADGAESVVVQITGQADTEVDLTSGAVTSIVLADGTGTLDVAADGTWSFTPANGLDQTVNVTFTVEVTDNDGDVASDDHTIAITPDNENPQADPVTTLSNQDSDGVLPQGVIDAIEALQGPLEFGVPTAADLVSENRLVFFKEIVIGGEVPAIGNADEGVDTNSDPLEQASLGGVDNESGEDALSFDITSLPSYGTLIIEVDNGDGTSTFTALDLTNVNDASSLLSTADTVYWVATTNDIAGLGDSELTSGFVGGNNSQNVPGVSVIARGQDGESANLVFTNNNGWGVNEATGGPQEQLGFNPDTGGRETIIFDFDTAVTNAQVQITHLIAGESGGEVGQFEAFLDGVSLGVFTFSNNAGAGADFTLLPVAHGSGNPAGSNSGTLDLGGLVFDQIRFTATQYADQAGNITDSSDYFIWGIAYDSVPGVVFEYGVIDEAGNLSAPVDVVIDPGTDTPIPAVGESLWSSGPLPTAVRMPAEEAEFSDVTIPSPLDDVSFGPSEVGAVELNIAEENSSSFSNLPGDNAFVSPNSGSVSVEIDALSLGDILETGSDTALTDYLSLNFDGIDTIIDMQPTTPGGEPQQFVLTGFDPTGLGDSDQEILTKMLQDGMIKIDT
jgi:hypothetical protein